MNNHLKDTILGIFTLIGLSGALLLGIAGTNYRFRKGKLFINPLEYNKKEKRLFLTGCLLIVVGFTACGVVNMYLK